MDDGRFIGQNQCLTSYFQALLPVGHESQQAPRSVQRTMTRSSPHIQQMRTVCVGFVSGRRDERRHRPALFTALEFVGSEPRGNPAVSVFANPSLFLRLAQLLTSAEKPFDALTTIMIY
jgi:hypothetical protein